METIIHWSWSYVPEEVVYEILLRLPVKSLCRFNCVSKSWFSVISDPKFMSAHFDHSLANPKVLLVSVPKFKDDLFSEIFCSVDYTGKWGNGPQSVIADYHCQIIHENFYSRFSQSVGGLSLVITRNSLLICNPSTRESINLPPCPGFSHFGRYTMCGHNSYLGFDPVEKKYKVLSLWNSSLEMGWEDRRSYVLTLGEEAWRSVDFKYSPGTGSLKWSPKDYEFDSAGICVNGVLYYIYRDENTLDLVAFDVGLETFRTLSVPDGNALQLDIPTFLMEYEGCVAVVYMEFQDDDNGYQVIVVNILSDNSSNKEEWEWTIEEHFVGKELKRIVCLENLGGSSPNGELVFVSRCSSDLIKLNCCDLETDCLKKMRVCAPKDKKSTWSGLATKLSPARVFRHAERLEHCKVSQVPTISISVIEERVSAYFQLE